MSNARLPLGDYVLLLLRHVLLADLGPLPADLSGGLDLHFHFAAAFGLDVFFEIQSRHMVGFLHHGRRAVAVAHDDFFLRSRFAGCPQHRPGHQTNRPPPDNG